MPAAPAPRRAGLLARLGLDRPELRAWAMYDWANSAFMTVVVTAVFPIYFKSVAAKDIDPATSTAWFGYATTFALALAAVLSPPLGRLADLTGGALRLLRRSLLLGVLPTAGLFFVMQGDWVLALVLFVLANVGVSVSFVFYDALLPHVAAPEEMDRVSTAGYALGYIGGGIMLAIALALVLKPGLIGLPSGEGLTPAQATLPTRLGFLLTAAWWTAFAVPLFRRVRPPAASGAVAAGTSAWALARDAFLAAGQTLRDLRRYPQAFLMLLAFMLYNDGIQTIIRMATPFGEELGLDRTVMIAAIVLVQFVGIPFAFLFGALAGRVGAKAAIFGGIAAYVLITFIGFRMRTSTDFLVLAVLVGMVQGGTQALSRSLFASMIPAEKSGEFFGFFAIFEKFAGIFGPLLFALAISLTGSSRLALLTTLLFFAAGALVLWRVDVARGRADAATPLAAVPADS